MRMLFSVVVIISVMLSACPKQTETVAEPPSQVPEQTVSDPETGQDVTGEYLQSHLDDYFAARDEIFREARRRIAAGENPQAVYDDLIGKLEALQKKTDNAVKHVPQIGDVNVPEMFKRDMQTLDDIIHSDSEF